MEDEVVYAAKQVIPKKRFLVYTRSSLRSIEISDVGLFFLDAGITYLVTNTSEIIPINKSLNQIESRLHRDKFFRINRNMILAYKSINRIEPYFGNRLVVIFKWNINVKAIVSRERVIKFKEWLDE